MIVNTLVSKKNQTLSLIMNCIRKHYHVVFVYVSNSSCGLRATPQSWLFLICGQRRNSPVSIWTFFFFYLCIKTKRMLILIILCIHNLLCSFFCHFLLSSHWPSSASAVADSELPPRPSAGHVAHFCLKGAWRDLHEHHRAAF